MFEPTELVLVPSGISFILGGRVAFAFHWNSRIMLWDWYQRETWNITDTKTTKCVPSVESVRHFGTYQFPALRQMALFIWMTNISRKRFGPQVENTKHNDVIKWKHFPRHWPFVRGIHKGNPWVTDEVPSQRPVTAEFCVFFDLRLNKRLSKQWRRRWDAIALTVMFSDFFYRSLLNTLRGKLCDRQHYFS